MSKKFEKIAIILFNLGGPSNLNHVRSFLFKLFNDSAIITLPQPFRSILAFIIAYTRENKAKKLYELIGGKSPILEETKKQAIALEAALAKDLNKNSKFKIFVAMRYSSPNAEETMQNILKYHPNKVVLLPLYPQYSTTTTGSFFNLWKQLAKKYSLNKLNIKQIFIDSYFNDKNFINSHTKLLLNSYYKMIDKINKNKEIMTKDQNIKNSIKKDVKIKILFSAHSLPQKIIDDGDPYQKQIENSVALIMKNVYKDIYKDNKINRKNISHLICYQSKVGKLKWLEPNTENVILDIVKNGDAIIIVPISFVSEHLETLVELDIQYKDIVIQNSVIKNLDLILFERVSTLMCNEKYIECLKQLVLKDLDI